MTCFVPQNAHAFSVGATLHLQHLLSLEFHQTRVGQVKGNGDSRNTVRREPLFREPNVGLKSNAAIIQFAIETLDVRLEKRSLDLDGKIANTQLEQMLVRQAMPGKTVAHAVATSLRARVFASGSLVVCKAFSRSVATGMRSRSNQHHQIQDYGAWPL